MHLLWMMIFPLWLGGAMLQVGESVTPSTLQDQHEQKYRVGKERIWILTWDRSTTRLANQWYDSHPKIAFQDRVAMIVDVSQTPEGILSLFVLPRMRSYSHTILLSFDTEYNRQLPYKAGNVTVLILEKGVIKEIKFAPEEVVLKQILKEALQ